MDKGKLVLGGSVVLALLIGFWGLAFNRGELVVVSEVQPFTVAGMFDQPTTCENRECSYEVKPRIYNLTIIAEGYTSQTNSVNVKRNRSAEVEYVPLPVPQLAEAAAGDDYTDLLYAVNGSGGETEIWLRDPISDQKLTTLASGKVERFYNSVSNPLAMVLLDDASVVEIDKVRQRKQVVNVSRKWDQWRLLGEGWLAWNEGTNFFYAPFAYQPNTKLPLPVTSVDHVVAADKDTAYFVSQIQTGAASGNQEGDSFVDLFIDLDNLDLADIGEDSPYYLYQLDMLNDEIIFLDELPWTGKNNLRWQERYSKEDLSLSLYLFVDGEAYELG